MEVSSHVEKHSMISKLQPINTIRRLGRRTKINQTLLNEIAFLLKHRKPVDLQNENISLINKKTYLMKYQKITRQMRHKKMYANTLQK